MYRYIIEEWGSVMKNMLIVYYSWSNGNTERIARRLSEVTGADIEKLETVIPYKGTYREVVDQGKREVDEGYMPEIKALSHDINDYKSIVIGTPTWWYTMAPAVRTFMEGQNWSGKTVIPFMTNGGWPGHCIKDMCDIAAGSKTACKMEIKFDSNGGDELRTDENDIEKWMVKVKELSVI